MQEKHITFGKYSELSWNKLSSEYLYGLADMGNIDAQNELIRRAKLPIEEQIIGFGKHIGKYWIELDDNYLQWITDTMEPTNDKVILAYATLDFKQKNKLHDVEYCDFHEYSEEIDIIQIDE